MFRIISYSSVLSFIILFFTQLTYGFDQVKTSVYENGLLTCINNFRVENHLPALSFDVSLIKLAKSHSEYMNRRNDLNHDHFHDRFRTCKRTLCVENVGWNHLTPEAQSEAWKASGSHNKNLLNTKIKYAGIAKAGAYVTFFACD